MKTLLRKDWRLARPILIAATILWLIPPALGVVYDRFCSPEPTASLQEGLTAASQMLMLSLLASSLAAPVLAGIMFAKERRERTAELVATMPARRRDVVLSKAAIAACASILPWVVTIAALAIIGEILAGVGSLGYRPVAEALRLRNLAPELGVIGSGTFMAFGVAWLSSTILRSEVIAACCAFFAVLALFVLVIMLETREVLGAISSLAASLALGGIGAIMFVVGCVIALRRASP